MAAIFWCTAVEFWFVTTLSRHQLVAGALLAGLLTLAFHEWRRLPDGKLHVHVFDVGQGDGILLVTPSGKQVVIDGGPDLSLLSHLGEHLPFLDRKLELVMLTHPDADHITALPDVLRRYRVERIVLNGTQHRTGRYEALLDTIIQTSIPVITPDPSQDIDLGDGVVLDVIWPLPGVFGTEPKHGNDESFVIKVLYKDQSILLTGDIEEVAEQAILASGADLRADVLKVPHHGSRTSSSTGFLLAVQPELALISAGRENKFGHPHNDVILRYEQMRIPVRNTQKEGTLSLVFD
jgi:competence protein ComEC